MNEESLEALWTRHLDGAPLPPHDRSRLERALQSDVAFRERCLDDASGHARLTSLARIKDPDDRFVLELERRLGSASTGRGHAPERTGRGGRARFARPSVVTAAAALLIAALLGFWAGRAGSAGIATIAYAEGARWKGDHAIGDRLSRLESLWLEAGTALVTFDHGASFELRGPSRLELVAEEELRIWSGTVTARLPEDRSEFTVLTPLSRVRERGATFSLEIGADGRTSIRVIEGHLRLLDGPEAGAAEPRELTLAPGGLDRAELTLPPARSGLRPVVTRAKSADGEFFGRISLGSATVQLHGETLFQDLLEEVLQRPSPDDLVRDWRELSMRFGPASGAQVRVRIGDSRLDGSTLEDALRVKELPVPSDRTFTGTIVIDGEARNFDSYAEFEEARRELDRSLDRFRAFSTSSSGASSSTSGSLRVESSSFRGSIERNGRRVEFDSQEAYEKALRESR